MRYLYKFLLLLLLATFSVHGLALDIKPYSAADFAAAQQSGAPVALHFHADWCPTCLAQQKVIFGLRQQGGRDITIYVAKFDDEKPLRKRHRVVTQSTLIVFRGRVETGRIAGVTDPATIARTLDSAR